MPDPARWRVLGVISVSFYMTLASVSIINVALPSIQDMLPASDVQIQWVLAGYTLTFGVILVASGRAGDIVGRGGLFIVGVSIFTLSSMVAGLAPDAGTLIAARLVQGVGSGLVGPQTLGLVQQYFRGAERGRAFGIIGAIVGFSLAAGPVMGGLIIQLAGDEHGWRWTFFVNAPFGVLAIILALAWFARPIFRRPTRDADAAESTGDRRGLDVIGALLLAAAVLFVLLPFTLRDAGPWVWALLPFAVLAGWLWVRWERHYAARGNSPMVDLAIFRIPSFTAGTVLIGVYFLGMPAFWVIIALYLQDGLGHAALAAGLVGVPSSLLTMYFANWAGHRVSTRGRRIVIAGLIAVLSGILASILVVQLRHWELASEWWLLATLAFVGIGQGLVVSPNQALTLEDVPLSYAGSSAGIMQTGQRVGSSIGITVVTTIAFLALASADWTQAATAGFVAVAPTVIAALAAAVADQRRRQAA